MSSKSVRRASFASLTAVCMSILLTGQVAAASWTDPSAIETWTDYEGPYSAELAPLTGSTAVVGYGMTNSADIARVVVRRTYNAGATWKKPTLVTDHGWGPSTSGRGTDVDIVWLWNGRVHYAHSADTGVTFGDYVTLSPLNGHAFNPRVARGPNDVVAVVWNQDGVARARVSTDGGASFAGGTTIAKRGYAPRVAVGNGVIYVLYSHGDYDDVRVVRTLNNGATWSGRMIVSPDSTSYSITAEGVHAYIGYEATSDDTYWALHYRGTSNRGTTWSEARDLLPPSWSGYSPQLSLRGGILRAIFVPCNNSGDICDDRGRIFYRQTPDGIHWSTPERVSPKSLYSEPRGVGFSGKVIVMYQANVTQYYVPVLFSRARVN